MADGILKFPAQSQKPKAEPQKGSPPAVETGEEYWASWLAEPVQDEESLRRYVLSLVRAAQQASFHADLARIRELVRAYELGAAYCQAEPLRSAYELGWMLLSLLIADNNFVAGEVGASLAGVEAVLDCLSAGDRRRAGLGMPVRPNSEVRYSALGLRAACFADPLWWGRETGAEALAVLRDFWEVADNLMPKLNAIPAEQRLSMLQSVARHEIEICKLAYKLGSTPFEEAVERFNARHQSDLSATIQPNRVDAATPRSAWYWDLEVWKHLHTPASADSDFAECLSQRKRAVRLYYSADCQHSNDMLWKRQARLLRASPRRNR